MSRIACWVEQFSLKPYWHLKKMSVFSRKVSSHLYINFSNIPLKQTITLTISGDNCFDRLRDPLYKSESLLRALIYRDKGQTKRTYSLVQLGPSTAFQCSMAARKAAKI